MGDITITWPAWGRSRAVPEGGSGTWRKPPAPKPATAAPHQSGAGRPVSTRRTYAPPRPRGRRRVLAVVGVLLVLGAVPVYAFKLTPIVTEKLLIAALYSRVPPVQRFAIRGLRDYPTKHAAIALVLFINLKNLQEVEDPKKPWTPEEKQKKRQQRVRDLELAERATLTLCLLTGQSFGTYFKLERHGYSWGSLSEDKWPTVVWQIDTWAAQTFGTGELPR